MSNSELQEIFHSGPNPLEVLPQTWKYSIVENIMVHRSIKTTQHIDFDFSLGRDTDNAEKKSRKLIYASICIVTSCIYKDLTRHDSLKYNI